METCRVTRSPNSRAATLAGLACLAALSGCSSVENALKVPGCHPSDAKYGGISRFDCSCESIKSEWLAKFGLGGRFENGSEDVEVGSLARDNLLNRVCRGTDQEVIGSARTGHVANLARCQRS